MTIQEPPSSQTHRDNATDRPHLKMHPRDQRINAFLLSCAEAIASIVRIVFLLSAIYIIVQTFNTGIFIETSITIIATVLFFYIAEKTRLARFFDWTIEDWKETEKPAKQLIYKFIVATTNIFIVAIAVTAGMFFIGYLIDIIREIGLLTLTAILVITVLVILFLERAIPIIDRLISPRMIIDDPNTDDQKKNGDE